MQTIIRFKYDTCIAYNEVLDTMKVMILQQHTGTEGPIQVENIRFQNERCWNACNATPNQKLHFDGDTTKKYKRNLIEYYVICG